MNNQGLTLMDLMISITIVGIMAAFAIPNYVKGVQKAEERQMMVNLRSIVAAQEVYKAKNGDYWPANAFSVPTANQGISGINAALKLNIQASGTKYAYQCNSVANQTYRCYAGYSPGAFAWQLYTSNTIARNNAYANQVCCDAAFNPGNPCPSVAWCP